MDGAFADALDYYLKQNEPYSFQELYEFVGAAVFHTTQTRQMPEMICESTELSSRRDLFITPEKFEEKCRKLEELKQQDAHSVSAPIESASLSDNLEFRTKARKHRKEAEHLREQLQAAMMVTTETSEQDPWLDGVRHPSSQSAYRLYLLAGSCVVLTIVSVIGGLLWRSHITEFNEALYKCKVEVSGGWLRQWRDIQTKLLSGWHIVLCCTFICLLCFGLCALCVGRCHRTVAPSQAKL